MTDITNNKRALFDYEVLQTYEAGIELYGFEVKSVKAGHIDLKGSYAVIKNEEAFLLNAFIPPYQTGNAPKNYQPDRTRKLLLHRSQIKELIGLSNRLGLTIIPLKVYNVRTRIKILIGLGRYKKTRDKRELIKKRETEREIRRYVKRG